MLRQHFCTVTRYTAGQLKPLPSARTMSKLNGEIYLILEWWALGPGRSQIFYKGIIFPQYISPQAHQRLQSNHTRSIVTTMRISYLAALFVSNLVAGQSKTPAVTGPYLNTNIRFHRWLSWTPSSIFEDNYTYYCTSYSVPILSEYQAMSSRRWVFY